MEPEAQLITVLGGIGVAIIAGLLHISRMHANRRRMRSLVFLQVLMPKKEGKEEKEKMSEEFSSGKTFKEVLGVMDHLYQSLYGLYESRLIQRLLYGQPYFSMEYAALEGEILFFVVVPRSLASFMEKQITSFYPDAVIDEVADYNIFTEESYTASTYLTSTQKGFMPFKTYESLKTDPLNAIINSFSKLGKDEGAAVQFILRPKKSGWHKKARKEAQKVLNPKKRGVVWWNPISWLSSVYTLMTYGTRMFSMESNDGQSTGERVSQMTEELSKTIDMKASSPGYEAIIRLATSASSQKKASANLDSVVGGFSQFSDVYSNGLSRTRYHKHTRLITDFIKRSPIRPLLQALRKPKLILSSLELAGFFHFPNITYNKVMTIKWQNFKIVPVPKNVPTSPKDAGENCIKVGTNIFRGEKKDVYIKHMDRFRHFYIIGQTGTGKSTMIINMAKQDFLQGNGLCVVDPHGSLIESLLPHIPRERADDVIYFNPADTERPMGLNMLEGKSEEERDLIALDAMNMMVKMFGEEIFGPRIQDYFRNGCLTLMADNEEGGAITDLVRLFTDDEWQKYKTSKVSNPIVKSFWDKQMASTGQREKQEMIPYFAAKFGQFTTNTLIRNIVGQVKSAFDFTDVMNNKKILLMNLSKGLIGDLNSQLLGMIVVNKVQVAAMRRQQLSDAERMPFFLYIDEFQNYVTDSIESILSEARKYKLGLCMAHQYLDQLEKESKLSSSVNLKGAVFGNVGSMMFYKVGAQDGEFCAKEMAPTISESDLVNMDKYKAVMRLSVDTQPSQPFSIIPENPYIDPGDAEAANAFVQLSRLTYGRDKKFVSREIERRIGASGPASVPPPPPGIPGM